MADKIKSPFYVSSNGLMSITRVLSNINKTRQDKKKRVKSEDKFILSTEYTSLKRYSISTIIRPNSLPLIQNITSDVMTYYSVVALRFIVYPYRRVKK